MVHNAHVHPNDIPTHVGHNNICVTQFFCLNWPCISLDEWGIYSRFFTKPINGASPDPRDARRLSRLILPPNWGLKVVREVRRILRRQSSVLGCCWWRRRAFCVLTSRQGELPSSAQQKHLQLFCFYGRVCFCVYKDLHMYVFKYMYMYIVCTHVHAYM